MLDILARRSCSEEAAEAQEALQDDELQSIALNAADEERPVEVEERSVREGGVRAECEQRASSRVRETVRAAAVVPEKVSLSVGL